MFDESGVAEQLAGELTIATVGERVHALSALTLGPGAVSIDCGAIQRIDVAGLQMLVALGNSITSAGGEVTFANRSEALLRALDRCGLTL